MRLRRKKLHIDSHQIWTLYFNSNLGKAFPREIRKQSDFLLWLFLYMKKWGAQ